MGAGQRVRVTQEVRLPGPPEVPGDERPTPASAETVLPAASVRLTDGIRLAVATEEVQRLERALAVSRAGLGGLLLLVETVVQLSWPRGNWTSVALSGIYALVGLAVWLWLRRHASTPELRRALQVFDILSAAVLSLMGDEVLVLVGVLAIYAAAARWTRIEAITTAAAISGLVLIGQLGTVMLSSTRSDFDGHAFFFRMSTLFLLSFLFSHVTRRGKELQDETLKAKAMDRALVARELHDGAIQSLIGMEVQIDVLRRRATEQPAMAEELSRIQTMLRREILNLRELMRQMKPLDLDPRQLLDFLAESVDKFRREAGISASFVSDLREISLSPRLCAEIARIAQEALVNVRKHSGASNVIVRLTLENEEGRLVVDDDGRGFDFSGRLSQKELDVARKGPVIIKERVRSIGGSLAIESAPGRGARLEITFPNE
ncbi:MAG TPA: histidine kinase [Thermoanaerobaculia bacterium]